MSDNSSKTAFISGKLSGTKSVQTVLEEWENPDEVEQFLQKFYSLKLDILLNNEVIYIHDDQDFLEYLQEIENNEYIGIFINESLNRFCITTDVGKTYIVKVNKVSSSIIGKFISQEKPIKFSLNSFQFMKWCVAEKIDMRNVYDIPTYIKILTNEVDPFKGIEAYIAEYTNSDLMPEDNETNSIMIGNFVYHFGKFLHDYATKFGIDSVCKLINENSYYEAIMTAEGEDNCVIQFSYTNLKQAIESIVSEKEKEFENKAYVVSPLGRIAVKYGHKVSDVIEELYAEDISITILNELYNNNIHVTLDEEGNYAVHCKYKNVNNVFSLLIAMLNDIFYTMFKQSFEANIQCKIKES